MSISDLLISKNIISDEDAARYDSESKESGVPLEDVLIKNGITEEAVAEAKSEFLEVPFINTKGQEVPFEVLERIPEKTANIYKFIPLGEEDGVLFIGMVKPDDLEAREALRFLLSKSNTPFKIYLITKSEFERIFKGYKGITSEAGKILGDLETTLGGSLKDLPGFEGNFVQEEVKKTFEAEIKEEAPIVKMVGIIIRHAIEGKSSDIHIEPLSKKLRVRFRMDGALYTSLLLPLTVHDAIVSRIKILTNMLLDEKRKPQDGRFSVKFKDREIDFRVSTFPTHFGEKVVIRVLDPEKKISSLEGVGLSGRNLEVVLRALEKPYGMILITGPTGSGKSTTLYAMLQKLNTEDLNIVSLEDPIEYNIEGLNQSQVRPEIGYDFADGLRSILRQDPDIIMVGEIRDKETASLAVHAALTGHLVLSTLHTNTAIGAIPRLIDMGVDPYLLSPTLILVLSQRLVRTLCDNSKKPLPFSGNLKKNIEKELLSVPSQVREKVVFPGEIYQAKPSAVCPSGTKGRIGIFEVVEMTPNLEQIILAEPSMERLETEARRQGMITLREDGLLKVLDGKIGLEELSEVIVANNIEI